MPTPKNLLRATAEANNLAAKALAKEHYIKLMDLVFFLLYSFFSANFCWHKIILYKSIWDTTSLTRIQI
jgi:hypothetical protein